MHVFVFRIPTTYHQDMIGDKGEKWLSNIFDSLENGKSGFSAFWIVTCFTPTKFAPCCIR